jgi:hypothetical protein
MSVKDMFYKLCRRKLGNGLRTRFWEDIWWRDKSLSETFPNLYAICVSRDVTVAEVINSNCEVLKFRRTLVGDNLQLWLQLQDICRGTVLGNVKDSLVWGFDAKGFSVKSCYKIMK